ncbi:MAG: helix-turn-helix domain-containing protein [Burkholderiales bacterium]|nr:AraC family transcriptional regulator [Nitrosomonadaceae bacterium]
MATPDEQQIHLYVWPDRFLYLGPSTATSMHRNHAATWLVAEKGALRVTLGSGAQIENEVVFVPSETDFRTDVANTLIAALYWEPESASFLRATSGLDTGQARGFRCDRARANQLSKLYMVDTSLDEADRLLAGVFGLASFASEREPVNDIRVLQALAFLRADPTAYESIENLAARVHLSASRFAHVFKEQVGVPVRRYVLWLKMRAALDAALAGQSLTASAITAGFADSAHLSRTVRSLLGVAPEFLFRRRERLIIHR